MIWISVEKIHNHFHLEGLKRQQGGEERRWNVCSAKRDIKQETIGGNRQ